MIQDFELRPPNLAALGVKRRGDGRIPDLQTIWVGPYPVLTRYGRWCKKLGWAPFGGGDMHNLGTGAGFPTSGYRDKIIEGRENSPHLYAIALDCFVPAQLQEEAAIEADKLFARVGMYPERNFMHLDLVNEAWMAKFGGRRYWVEIGGRYKYFDAINDAIEYANT